MTDRKCEHGYLWGWQCPACDPPRRVCDKCDREVPEGDPYQDEVCAYCHEVRGGAL